MHLFAYGTLMFPEIWRRVVGREFGSQAAELVGFVVLQAQDDVYPVMLRSTSLDRVRGLIYFDLDDEALARLDDYESELYDRVAVDATLSNGETAACQAYVLPASHERIASSRRWDAAWFEREAMANYLQRLGG